MDIIDVINIINETYENIYKEFNSSFMYSSAQITLPMVIAMIFFVC